MYLRLFSFKKIWICVYLGFHGLVNKLVQVSVADISVCKMELASSKMGIMF